MAQAIRRGVTSTIKYHRRGDRAAASRTEEISRKKLKIEPFAVQNFRSASPPYHFDYNLQHLEEGGGGLRPFPRPRIFFRGPSNIEMVA